MPIRTRQPEDLDGCVAVLRRVYETTGYPSGWPQDAARWLSPVGQVAAWVAEDDGRLAGHIGLVQGVPTQCLLEATGREASGLAGIVRLFVDPGSMRKGLARALLAVAAGYAKARGLQPVLDVVADDEGAVALYEGSGWKLAGTQTATWVTSAGVSPTLRCYVAP